MQVRPRQPLRAAVVSAVLTLGLAPSAFAQGANPVSPGLPTPAQPTTTTATPTIANGATTTTSTSTDSGLSGSNALAIAIGALVVLGGISFFIWRDARRRAPARHRAAAAAGAEGRSGTKRPVKARKLSPAERKRRKRGRAR
jgi:hypothetical protein